MISRHTPTVLTALAPLVLLLGVCPAPALGQTAAGIRASRFRVHPEARVEGRFDSNLYREDTVEENPTPVGFVRLMPSVRITNPYPTKVAIDGSAGLEVRQYLNSVINEGQDAVGMNVAAGATLGQGGAFALSINEDLRRQLEPGQGFSTDPTPDDPSDDEEVGDKCKSPCTLSFWRNVLRIQGRMAPGGGRLVLAPSYKYTLIRFEEFDTTDKDEHEIRFGGSYRFFPRTSFVIDASYLNIEYLSDEHRAAELSPVRIKAGLRGLITTRLAATLTAGYGDALASKSGESNGDTYAGFIAQTELVYQVSNGLRARVSYSRDFADSAFSNVVTVDRVGAKIQAALGPKFNASADFAASLRGYSSGYNVDPLTIVVAADELANRKDTFLTGNVAGSYHANDWLVVTGGYRLEQNITSYGVSVKSVENFSAFARHQIFMGAGLLL